ncbi:MAG TPA: ribonuclease R [Williamwhitmania sp.]|nr:ribonuclease R [Williamwhitmania sp.]
MTKKRSQKEKQTSTNKKNLTQTILEIFSSNPGRLYGYKSLAKILGLQDDGNRRMVVEICYELASDGFVEQEEPGLFRFKGGSDTVMGKVDMIASGAAFIVPEDKSGDIFVSFQNLNHALHNDKVRVHIFKKRRGNKPEGEVVEIVERARKNFVGTIQITKNFGFLTTGSKDMPYDIFIPEGSLKDVKNGEKAIARIVEWPMYAKNPIGEIVDVLGAPGNNEVEMHAILAEYDLPYHFPEEVNKVAERIADKISATEYKERRDFMQIPTFTIDPADAKDFDDALSFRRLPNGNVEVGVHIADVTHYVTPTSVIDNEAVERATSVYLVDRTVPMLPERLSNQICSLRPDEEKLCFSAVFELDGDAIVVAEWFGRTIIKSQRRFSYEEAQQVIETNTGDMKEEIVELNRLARILRKRRFKDGAIAFERDEVKFELDEHGKPLRVFYKVHKESNQLIEEFMLLANKKVAEIVGKVGKKKTAPTFVYRIHDQPNPEKFNDFRKFITRFGYALSPSLKPSDVSSSINHLLEEIKDKPESNLISTLAIRSMAKARYSTDNVGHYGLAFPFYTHFTSPIRRYPDMMVHRLLAHYLADGKSKNKEEYETLCAHSSEMEQRAADAERASIKYKQVEFMTDKVGKAFDAVITGVADFGIFTEIVENKCEGLVSMRELDDDYYYFDEESYTILGKTTGKAYRLGDPIKITVLQANMAKRQLDYGIFHEEGEERVVKPEGERNVGRSRPSAGKPRSGGGGSRPKSGGKSGSKSGGKSEGKKRRRS